MHDRHTHTHTRTKQINKIIIIIIQNENKIPKPNEAKYLLTDLILSVLNNHSFLLISLPLMRYLVFVIFCNPLHNCDSFFTAIKKGLRLLRQETSRTRFCSLNKRAEQCNGSWETWRENPPNVSFSKFRENTLRYRTIM